MINAQLQRSTSALDFAESDFKEAIRRRSKDPADVPKWRKNLDSVAMLRRML